MFTHRRKPHAHKPAGTRRYACCGDEVRANTKSEARAAFKAKFGWVRIPPNIRVREVHEVLEEKNA